VDTQKACEIVEELVQKETMNNSHITLEEFLALNKVLFELQAIGKYQIPAKFQVD
jgi:hypothetical protein